MTRISSTGVPPVSCSDWHSMFVQEARRVLPLLAEWHDALVRRDLARIDALTQRILPMLERIEEARSADPSSKSQPPSEEVVRLAMQIDQLLQSAYDIIQNELEYTYGLMALLVRAREPDHYAPTVERGLPNILLNTEA